MSPRDTHVNTSETTKAVADGVFAFTRVRAPSVLLGPPNALIDPDQGEVTLALERRVTCFDHRCDSLRSSLSFTLTIPRAPRDGTRPAHDSESHARPYFTSLFRIFDFSLISIQRSSELRSFRSIRIPEDSHRVISDTFSRHSHVTRDLPIS